MAFGGRGQRFGNFHAANSKKSKTDDNKTTERGADGAAMADDFYQRDVKAEYDELDYDANEQFDDDDVDLGAAEVVVDNDGFGGADGEDGDADGDSDASMADEDQVVTGAAGLATAAGFKLLLAKARGEVTVVPAAGAATSSPSASRSSSPTAASGATSTLESGGAATLDQKKDDAAAAGAPGGTGDKKGDGRTEPEELDHIAKIKAAAEKSRIAADKKARSNAAAAGANSRPEAAIEKDEQGLRIISLQAVRREIWLNHGKIAIKRLMKIFNVGKKFPEERQGKFREVVKELCTMENDPVTGRTLVLKQHYYHM